MDASYKDSAIEQILGNPTLDYDFKLDLIKVINGKSESSCKALCRRDGNGRFFYDTDGDELKADLKSITNQREVNRLRRAGIEFESEDFNKEFPATYRRGGHLYVNGIRKY